MAARARRCPLRLEPFTPAQRQQPLLAGARRWVENRPMRNRVPFPRRLLSVALCALAVLAPVTPALAEAAKEATKNPFLKAGIRLYNDLEFAAALEQLKK